MSSKEHKSANCPATLQARTPTCRPGLTKVDRTWDPRVAPPGCGPASAHGLKCRWTATAPRAAKRSAQQSTNKHLFVKNADLRTVGLALRLTRNTRARLAYIEMRARGLLSRPGTRQRNEDNSFSRYPPGVRVLTCTHLILNQGCER